MCRLIVVVACWGAEGVQRSGELEFLDGIWARLERTCSIVDLIGLIAKPTAVHWARSVECTMCTAHVVLWVLGSEGTEAAGRDGSGFDTKVT